MKFNISNTIELSSLPAPLIRQLEEKYTLPNPKYREAVKFKRRTSGIDPRLKFCTLSSSGTLSLPRGVGNDIFKLLSQHGKVEIIDRRRTLSRPSLEFKGDLHSYQQQAVEGMLSKDFGVLEAGTGAGKTVMALALIAARKQPTLILIHTKELLHQWQERIKTFLGIDAGLIGDGRFDIQPITVAIVNSARKHLDELPKAFGHLVVDECHRVPSTLFTETTAAFATKYMTGLSATPYRRDGLGKLIGWYLGSHRVKVGMSVLHDSGAILHPKIIRRETAFRYAYADDYQKLISALVKDNKRNALVVEDIRKQAAKGGLSLVVSDRVKHLEELAERSGTEHCLLTGKTSAKKRKEIVEALADGKTKVLFSTLSLIGEGFDCPAMDSLFLTTPIKFEGRLKQVVGRVLRPSDNKEPLVYDYQDVNVGVLRNQAKSRQRVYAAM